MSKNLKKYLAEGIGTAILVLFGCGTAVFTRGDVVATALAFGLAIVAVAYALGDISGAHVNPAVSFAMLITKKLKAAEFGFYVLAQFIGAFVGALLLWAFIALMGGDKSATGLGTNGFGSFGAWGAFLVEVILTFVFVYAILGVTGDRNKSNIAGIVIGLVLTFVHILGIRLTGTSVNPARSFAPAVIMGGEVFGQVWVFILAPFFGSALAAVTYKLLNK